MKMDFKLESRQLIWDYLLLTVGALLTAFAFAAFFVTNDIAPGGVTGIATVLSSVTGLNVGLLSFLINVPLFAIGWRRVGDPDRAMLELTWRESGGPPVEPPASRSFGRSLIERLVPRAIDGASDLVFESDGLAWTLRFPVKRDHLEPPAA